MPLRPIRTVLAATDLGQSTDAVVASAALVAERCGATLHLVHVLETSRSWLGGSSDAGLVGRVEAARRDVGEQVSRVLGGRAAPTVHVEAGTAHREILGRAGALGADLLVVGAHRGGAVETHFLGTTAERVIQGSAVPCLVVKSALALPLGSIGVPTDVRDPAPGAVQAALGWSVRLAGNGAPPPVRVVYAGWELDAQDDPSLEARVVVPALAEVVAGGAAVDLGGAPRARVTSEVVWGSDPAGQIARWARREGVGLLVLATHGSGGLRRLLAGSVAQAVARQASAPVLLLPPSWWEAPAEGS